MESEKSPRTLLIDDIRELQADRTARTFDEALAALQSEVWDHVYLDHDLGDPMPARTGTGICNWLKRNSAQRPKNIFLITANPVGRDRMGQILASIGYHQFGSCTFRLEDTTHGK